jgi:hypothetical protein
VASLADGAPSEKDLGDVALLQDGQGTRVGGNIQYSVSFQTYDDPSLAASARQAFASDDTMSIEIKGDGGTTGVQTLVEKPGKTQHVAKIEEIDGATHLFHGDLNGGASSSYDPDDRSLNVNANDPWQYEYGQKKTVRFTALDVGQVNEVIITSGGTDAWTVSGIKVDTDDPRTALGNGAYFVKSGQPITSSTPLDVLSTGATTSDGDETEPGLVKCDAGSCEELMRDEFEMRTVMKEDFYA